jgi:tetratricopeptide (TPR) repeat protein
MINLFPAATASGFVAAAVLLISTPIAATFAADPMTAAPKESPVNSPRNICFEGGFSGSRVNAQRRMADCSEALQSHKLSPADVALARLYRGAARMKLGDTIMASADYQEAIKHYDSAIDPKEPNALELYRRAAALDALGQTDRALNDYSEAIRVNPKDPLAFLGRGVLFAGRQRLYERAIDDFDKVLVLAPSSVDGLMHRGDAYSQMGKFGPALADLDRAVALAPDNAEAYVYRGVANSRRNENSKAMVDYTAGLARDPDNVDALVNRAAIYSTNGEQALAIADLDAAIALKKDDPLAFYNRGYAHFANRQYGLATADYSSAIGLDPAMGLAYTNRCLTRAIVGKDLAAALGDCNTALKLMPDDANVRDTRGFVFLKMGEVEIAIQEYDAALKIKPDQALSLYGRGLARIKGGHAKEGAADKASALALNPAIARQFSGYGLE